MRQMTLQALLQEWQSSFEVLDLQWPACSLQFEPFFHLVLPYVQLQ
jgi:hypothetical protein